MTRGVYSGEKLCLRLTLWGAKTSSRLDMEEASPPSWRNDGFA